MSSRPALTPRIALGVLLFLSWLEGGYTALLVTAYRTPFVAALWQAALCLAAIPILLLAVVQFVSLPKPFVKRLPRLVVEFLWLLGSASEVALPWLGWTTLLWLLHGGRWAGSLLPGAAVAAFSYLTGALILLFFRPRPRSVRLTRLELALPGLPGPFDGYRLLHVSDLHVGVYNPAPRARARLALARDLEADLVVFTGDLTDDPRALEESVEALATLRGRDGTVAVMGNHDNWLGAAQVCAALAQHGLRSLVNARRTLRREGAVLHIAGVDNAAYSDRDDLAAALEGVGEKEAVVLLSHAPEIVLRPRAARAALILCGHTHGGQIVLPLYGPFYVPSKVGRRYASGLFALEHGWLFVSRGMGEIFPPLRVLCPPELALITLRCAPRD